MIGWELPVALIQLLRSLEMYTVWGLRLVTFGGTNRSQPAQTAAHTTIPTSGRANQLRAWRTETKMGRQTAKNPGRSNRACM